MDVRARYAQGNYRKVAERLRPAAVALVDAAGVAPGQAVVDVAAGTGNVSAAAVARGAVVVAVDLSPEQVGLGTADTDDQVRWVIGDAGRLPLATGVADAVLSTFGSMYVPDADAAFGEMLRVCRPGGVVGQTSWVLGGFQSNVGQLMQKFLPVETHDTFQTWGVEDDVRRRFLTATQDVAVQARELVSSYASYTEYWTTVLEQAPPLVYLRSQLQPTEFDRFCERLEELTWQHATAESRFVLRDEYLLAVGQVPAF